MRKPINVWILNKMLLYNPWVKEEITREIRKYLEINKNKNILKLMTQGENNAKGKFVAIAIHIKKRRKTSNPQCYFIPSGTRKRIS